MMVALSGPKDKPAMDINVVIDPISLTISPAIVRLIIHATKTLIPEKVVHTALLKSYCMLDITWCVGSREGGGSS